MIASFGQWLLKRSRNGWVAAGLLAPFPLLGWLSGIIIALVTLRRGVREGALVTLAASLPFVVMLVSHNDYSFYLILKCTSLVMVWLLAALLRQTRSWYSVVGCATIVAALAVVGLHGVVGDAQAFWMQKLLQIVEQMLAQAQSQKLTAVVMALDYYKNVLTEHHALPVVANIATGLFAMNVALGVVMQLLFARYWQSELFHPGGLREEVYQTRLRPRDSIVLGVCCLGALVQLKLCIDLLPVLLLPFLFVSVCIVQRYFTQKAWSQFAFYFFCLGMAVLVPYSLVALVVLSIVDSVVDLRRHLHDNKVMR